MFLQKYGSEVVRIINYSMLMGDKSRSLWPDYDLMFN